MNTFSDEKTDSELRIIDRICYKCVGDLSEPGTVCPHCGWDNSVRRDDFGHLPAMTIGNGRFFIGKPLGSGGFGVTYIGRDLQAGAFEDARRAIKEYFPVGMAIRGADGISVHPSSSGSIDNLDRLIKRAKKEGEAIQKAGDRTGSIVKAYDCIEANGTTYIIMEYINGDTLSDVVKQRGRFEWQEAARIFEPVLDALEKMHGLGIFHMDISPDNVMLRKKEGGGYGEAVILDFGASLNFRPDALTQSKTSLAVHDGFSPPEQYNIDVADEVDPAKTAVMDEYSVCATLYYAIAGQEPIGAIQRLAGGKKLQPLSRFDKKIPEYFDNALQKGMSLAIPDRYSSIAALKKALLNPKNPILRLKIAAAAAAVCAAALTVFLLIRPDTAEAVIGANGNYVWQPRTPGATAELVGTREGIEARYRLSKEGAMVCLKELTDYQWVLEETDPDGHIERTILTFADT